MSELSLHGIKKISVIHNHVESEGDYFPIVKILIEAEEAYGIKDFTISLFTKKDAVISLENIMMTYAPGTISKNRYESLKEEIENLERGSDDTKERIKRIKSKIADEDETAEAIDIFEDDEPEKPADDSPSE